MIYQIYWETCFKLCGDFSTAQEMFPLHFDITINYILQMSMD